MPCRATRRRTASGCQFPHAAVITLRGAADPAQHGARIVKRSGRCDPAPGLRSTSSSTSSGVAACGQLAAKAAVRISAARERTARYWGTRKKSRMTGAYTVVQYGQVTLSSTWRSSFCSGDGGNGGNRSKPRRNHRHCGYHSPHRRFSLVQAVPTLETEIPREESLRYPQ